MSSKITVLGVGYATSKDPTTNNGRQVMMADGSCCLVQSAGMRVLFDTMGPWQKGKLIRALSEVKIHPDDIDYIVCSHSHPDHIGNLNLFTKAKTHIVGRSVYADDNYDLECFEPIGDRNFKTDRNGEIDYILYEPYKLDHNLYVDPTPGHTLECVSLIVKNCENLGTVALVGDLFEREEDVDDESIWLGAGCQNSDLQRAHRWRMYEQAAHIFPGHGPLFATDRGKLAKLEH